MIKDYAGQQIRIGSVHYTLEFVDKLLSSEHEKMNGEIHHNECRLSIEADMHPQEQAITFLHEAIHGLLSQNGIREHDERFIDALSHALYGFICDNSGLLQELTNSRAGVA